MGAWGYGVFDDDSAYDVTEELAVCDDIAGYLEKAFDDAIASDNAIWKDGAMSLPECVGFDEGIAAAVCGAVLDSVLFGTPHRFDGFIGKGEAGKSGDEQYLEWMASIKGADYAHLKPKAVAALKKLISENSELNELWSESGQYESWKTIYTQMIARLQE